MPVDFVYLSINAIKSSRLLMDPYPNNSTSSMKSVWVTSSVPETLIHFIVPSGLALRMILLKIFVTSKKMKRDKGHPCLKPLVGLKKLDGDPFIITANEVDCKHPIIHSTTSIDMPFFISKILTKVHPTMSYAFDKCSFKEKALLFSFLMV